MGLHCDGVCVPHALLVSIVFPLFELVYGNIGQKSVLFISRLAFECHSDRPSQPQASVIVIVVDGLGTHRTLGLTVWQY